MKSALVTLSIRPDPTYRAANLIHKAYATKWGLRHECIDSEKLRFRPNLIRKRRVGIHCEKFQIYQLLEEYDRLVYLDCDTLINAACPNLLNLVPEKDWGCLYEDPSPHNWKGLDELRKMEKRFGELGTPNRRYFNGGVLVLNKSHRPVFEPDRKQLIPGRWPEQTLLNYRVTRMGVPVCELPPEYNFLPFFPGWTDAAVRRSQMIIHYAGTDTKAYMEDDLSHFLNAWGTG